MWVTAVALFGYDDSTKRFEFANSWGTRWGDAGYGYLPYDYFPLRLLEGWTITEDLDTRTQTATDDCLNLRTWGIDGLLGGVLHGAEIVNPSDLCD